MLWIIFIVESLWNVHEVFQGTAVGDQVVVEEEAVDAVVLLEDPISKLLSRCVCGVVCLSN